MFSVCLARARRGPRARPGRMSREAPATGNVMVQVDWQGHCAPSQRQVPEGRCPTRAVTVFQPGCRQSPEGNVAACQSQPASEWQLQVEGPVSESKRPVVDRHRDGSRRDVPSRLGSSAARRPREAGVVNDERPGEREAPRLLLVSRRSFAGPGPRSRCLPASAAVHAHERAHACAPCACVYVCMCLCTCGMSCVLACVCVCLCLCVPVRVYICDCVGACA